MSELAHLRAYCFDPGARFEGGLLTAIERMQVAQDGELLDALFVRRDAATGALEAIDLSSGGGDATLASLLDFRLDADRRRALSERTLEENRGGVPPPLIEAVATSLEAGAAMLAVIHTAPSVALLEDAVVRCGGRSIADEPVDARTLAEVGPLLRKIAGSPPPASAG
jgi:hypothetical protein